MIRDKRLRIAGALLLGVLSVLASAGAHAAPANTLRYACEACQSLTIQRDARIARVNFVDRVYELRRKRSSIGVKYGSATATLIIDGPSAVFVTEDRWQLGSCTESIKIISR